MATPAQQQKYAPQQIDLTTLSLQQLTQIKQQLDQELGIFQDSLQTLKMAQTKFQDSAENMANLKPNMKGRDVLVPLTGSIYVPGKIANDERVIIDIGTGYYVSKDIAGAKEYFQRKVKFVTEQMEKIQGLGMDKSKIRDTVIEVMENKIQGQMALQEKAKAAAAKA